MSKPDVAIHMLYPHPMFYFPPTLPHKLRFKTFSPTPIGAGKRVKRGETS